jgi:NAD(P)-dependent dehydrogenase (short-subunit alcohol dehydrogenase family)
MKTIVITGTSTGIGLAAAVSLARAGHDVFATMRNPARSTALQELAAGERLAITVVPLDVDSDASVAAGFRRMLDARGHIDVLVNNAGIAPLGSVEETPFDLFRATMETNYFGMLRCTRAVLPSMRERRSGRIINVSSVAGKVSLAGHCAYAASKFALEGLTDALASEVRAFNIHVNVVEPSVTETPIFGKSNDISGHVYPGARRMNAIFAAALEHPVAASVIADRIRDIVDDESWTVRYPGEPGAAAFMGWRASLSDEQYTALAALDDDEWCRYVETTLGLAVRSHLAPGPALT